MCMQALAKRPARLLAAFEASSHSLSSLHGNMQTDLVSLRDFKFPTHHTQHARWSHSSAAAAAAPAAPVQRAVSLDGRAVAAAWQDELAQQVASIRALGGRPPGLGVILVGDRPDSRLYVTRKREVCDRIGMCSQVLHLPATISQAELRHAVRALCGDSAVDGVLVQLPLPPHIDEEDIIEQFDPAKDVDGFHPLNVGRTLMRGRTARFVPCTALGCVELLRRSGVSVRGKSVAIVGDSNIVGMPLAMLFRDAGAATVTVVHRSSYSGLFSGSNETARQRARAAACLPRVPGPSVRVQQPYEVTYSSGVQDAYRSVPPRQQQQQHGPPPHLAELAAITRTADILVVAVGFPQLVKRDWIKPGAVVVDVGINVVDWGEPTLEAAGQERDSQRPRACCEGAPPFTEPAAAEDHPLFHVVGDVDYCEAVEVASALTPVPGGVGPMTIAALLHNTVQAAAANLGVGGAAAGLEGKRAQDGSW